MGWKKAGFFFLNNRLLGEKNYGVGLSHQEWQTWSSHAVLGTSEKNLEINVEQGEFLLILYDSALLKVFSVVESYS